MTKLTTKFIVFFGQTAEKRGTAPALFLSGFVLHMWLGFYMEPTPLSADAIFMEYRISLVVVEAMLTALLPVIAYKLAVLLEIKPLWQRLVVVGLVGLYPAVLAHTKSSEYGYSLSEVFALLFPAVIALLLLKSAELSVTTIKRTNAKRFTAVFIVVTAVFAVAVDERMLAVAAAVFLTVVIMRLCLNRELVSMPTFLIAFLVFAGAAYFVIPFIARGLGFGRDSYAQMFTFHEHVSTYIPDIDLLSLIAGHFYYFAVATWGLGVLGLCLFVKMMRDYAVRIKSNSQKKTEKSELADLNRRVKLLAFSMYAFFALLFTLGFSVIDNLEALTNGLHLQQQELLMFGMYMDSVIPLILVCTVCAIFMHGLDLRTLLMTTVVLGVIFTLFFALTAGIIAHGQTVAVSAILGLYPLRIGVDIGTPITFDTLFLSVSAVFSLMALFIVFISCGGRWKTRIITGAIAIITIHCMVYTCAIYMPYVRGLQQQQRHEQQQEQYNRQHQERYEENLYIE
jgi:hypothetical protein